MKDLYFVWPFFLSLFISLLVSGSSASHFTFLQSQKKLPAAWGHFSLSSLLSIYLSLISPLSLYSFHFNWVNCILLLSLLYLHCHRYYVCVCVWFDQLCLAISSVSVLVSALFPSLIGLTEWPLKVFIFLHFFASLRSSSHCTANVVPSLSPFPSCLPGALRALAVAFTCLEFPEFPRN